MLDWVKKIHQEKKLEVLEEMVRVVLLCTVFLGHRPKMSKSPEYSQKIDLRRDWKLLNRSDSVSECSSMINEFMSSSDKYSDLIHDFMLLVQAMELLYNTYNISFFLLVMLSLYRLNYYVRSLDLLYLRVRVIVVS